jgi:Skp family chaperone for outer membrane proteins
MELKLMKTVLMSAIPTSIAFVLFTFSANGQTTTVASPVPGVVYINSQRVIGEAAAGRTEVARIQAMQQQKNNEIRAKQQALDYTRQQEATAADAETRTKLLKEEQDQRADLERATQQAQADLQQLQREVQSGLQVKVRAAIEELAKTHNFKLVLTADTSVVWGAPGMDVTGLVIEKLNAAAAAPQPQKP